MEPDNGDDLIDDDNNDEDLARLRQFGGWYSRLGSTTYICSSCAKCPVDSAICKYRNENADCCAAATMRYTRIYKRGRKLLNKKDEHWTALEHAARWAAIYVRRCLETAQQVKDGADEKALKKFRYEETEAYREYSKAWRECGLSAHKGVAKKRGEFDESAFGE